MDTIMMKTRKVRKGRPMIHWSKRLSPGLLKGKDPKNLKRIEVASKRIYLMMKKMHWPRIRQVIVSSKVILRMRSRPIRKGR